MYIPRDRKIKSFNGLTQSDGHTVDMFVQEIERAMRAGGMSQVEQIDYIFFPF